MERVMIEDNIFTIPSLKAKLEYLSIFSGRQIKVTNDVNRVILPEQILIVVNSQAQIEDGITDGKVRFFEANKFLIPLLNEQCINKVISLYKNNSQLVEEKTKIKETEAFKKALAFKLKQAVDYKINDIKENMEFAQTELKLCQANIIELSKTLEEAKKRLQQTETMKDTIENDEERLKRAIEEIMALRKNNTFTKISFKLNEIVAETPVVYCEHEGKTYMFGRYEMHVSLDSNEVRIYNLTRQVEGFHHPHVNAQGIPCLGTLSDVIPKYMGRAEFAVILGALNTYLHSYNPASPYRRIEHWPKSRRKTK
ncbi:MAG: hypothetical protein V1659_00945 [Candidatus Woesearchaeota archaeon]